MIFKFLEYTHHITPNTVCFFSTATEYEDIAQFSDYAARWAIAHMRDN